MNPLSPGRMFRLLSRYRLLIGYIYLVALFLFMKPTLLSILVGGTIMMAGEFLRTWASGYIYKDQELATTGPYSIVRNPLYLGSFLIGLGATLISNVILLLILYPLLFLATYLPLILQEEEKLLKLFGDSALSYMTKVPRLLPSFRSYNPPFHPWSLEQAVFRHKEWLNWIFVGFFIGWGWWKFVG